MAQAFCRTCAAEVTVRGNRCLVGHRIENPPRPSRPGRHRSGRSAGLLSWIPVLSPPQSEAGAPSPPPFDSPLPVIRPAAWLGSERRPKADEGWVAPELLAFGEGSGRPRAESPERESHAHQGSGAQPETALGTITVPEPDVQDRLPRLSDMTGQDEEEVDTGSLIQRLWEASDPEPVDDSARWTPQEFSAKAVSSRSFRWSVAGLLVLLVIGALVLSVMATRVPTAQANAIATQYRSGLQSLVEAVPAAEQAALQATDPSVSGPELSETVVSLARLEARAAELGAMAAQPLPDPPLAAFNDPLRSLVPARDELQQTAQEAQLVAERVTRILDYRLTLAQAFRLPPLPISATPDETADLSVDLAVSVADTIELISQLPEDPFFTQHRRRALRLTGELEGLNSRYLDALRREDVDQATELANQITDRVAEVHDLSEPLGEAQVWTEEHLAQLRRLIRDSEELLGTPLEPR